MSASDDGDSYPKGLLRAARHLEDFADSYARTLSRCLSGELVLQRTLLGRRLVPPAVFLLVAHGVLFLSVLLLTAKASGKDPSAVVSDESLRYGLAGLYAYTFLACGLACGCIALLLASKPLDRVSYAVLFAAIARRFLEPVSREVFGSRSDQVAFWLLVFLALTAMFYQDLAFARPSSTTHSRTRPTIESSFRQWARWIWAELRRPDDLRELKPFAERVGRGIVWTVTTPRGVVSAFTLVGALLFFLLSSPDISNESPEPGHAPPALRATVAVVFETTVLNLKESFKRDRLKRSAYQVGLSLWGNLAQAPLGALAVILRRERPQLASGFLLASFTFFIMFTLTTTRARNRPGYVSIVMIGALGTVGASLSLLDGWESLADISHKRASTTVHESPNAGADASVPVPPNDPQQSASTPITDSGATPSVD